MDIKVSCFVKTSEKLADFGKVLEIDKETAPNKIKVCFVGNKDKEPKWTEVSDNLRVCAGASEIKAKMDKIKDHPKRYRFFLHMLGFIDDETMAEFEAQELLKIAQK